MAAKVDKQKKYVKHQQKLYHLLNWDEHGNLANFRLKIILAIFTIVAVVVVVIDSFSGMPLWWKAISLILNVLITGLFSVEYALRVWVAPLQFPSLRPWRARLRYIRKPAAVVDFVAIMPFYMMVLTDLDVTNLRVLWILRLFVLLKFNRYFHTLDNIILVIKHKRWELITSLLAVGFLMLISAALIYTIEGPVQPDKFTSILSGFWWAISTLLTIGYGDIYPVTGVGKLLASVVAVLGVGLIAVPTGIISAGYIEEMQERQNEQRKKFKALSENKAKHKQKLRPHKVENEVPRTQNVSHLPKQEKKCAVQSIKPKRKLPQRRYQVKKSEREQ